ncbi:hypothetical protein [Edaphobacter aggregans]|uniref:hypothetical protein n=1 Tax=Edaphobacter aggregans TaxID=570835 RepID=UPI0012FB02FA|nr:hypothetical protein [Edaphobacter aggregans]
MKSIRGDPEQRPNYSRFLPVVVAAAIALVLIILATVLVIGHRGQEIVPEDQSNYPTPSLTVAVPLAG